MNNLILCEGKTDAILLSYYLSQKCGWQFTQKAPNNLSIKEDQRRGESASWYARGEDHLLICAVGSKDRFQTFFNEKIRQPLITSDAFSKIALIIDHDDETTEAIEAKIRLDLPLIASRAQNNRWIPHSYQNGYQEEREVDFLLLTIPIDQQGALETLLLSAISEDPYDRNIVEKSTRFVDEIAPEAQRYIGKKRLILKAHLGVTWAIQSPQKVFDFIDEQLKTVKWEESEVLEKCFKHICEL